MNVLVIDVYAVKRMIASRTKATTNVESNTKLIGRPVPEISSFENLKMADFVTSLLTS